MGKPLKVRALKLINRDGDLAEELLEQMAPSFLTQGSKYLYPEVSLC